jgi:hypothetical protein
MNISDRGDGSLSPGRETRVAGSQHRLFEIGSQMPYGGPSVRRSQCELACLLCLCRQVCPPISVEETCQRRCCVWNDVGLYVQARLGIYQKPSSCMRLRLECQAAEVALNDLVRDGHLTCGFLGHGQLVENHIG